MSLNNPLRPRNRKLPFPPKDNKNELDEALDQLSSFTPSNNLNILGTAPIKKTISASSRPKIVPQEIPNAPTKTILKEDTEPRLDDYVSRRRLMSELSGLLSKGIENTLEKVDIKTIESDTNANYDSIRRKGFQKAIIDYFEAGKKFQEAGLRNNASLSFTCSVLSALLAEGEMVAESVWTQVQDIAEEQLKNAFVFQLIPLIFEGLKTSSRNKIAVVIEALKKIESFNDDDQELIANAAGYLAKRAKNFID